MEKSASTNPHLGTPVRTWGGPDAPIAVLGVHGRGQSPETIGELRTRIGGERAYWFAPSASGAEWYSRRFMDPELPTDPQLAWSLEAIDAAVDELGAAGYPPERILLLGFSQGACLATSYAIARRIRFAGLAVFIGGFIGGEGTAPEPRGVLSDVPVLLASTEADAWVPLSRVLETDHLLRAAGAQVTLLVEPGSDHAVSNSAASQLVRLIDRICDAVAGPAPRGDAVAPDHRASRV